MPAARAAAPRPGDEGSQAGCSGYSTTGQGLLLEIHKNPKETQKNGIQGGQWPGLQQVDEKAAAPLPAELPFAAPPSPLLAPVTSAHCAS